MEAFITILNNPVTLAMLLLLCVYVLNLISKGKIHRISKDGIELTDVDDPTQNARITKLEQQLADCVATTKETQRLVREQASVIKDIELATIRLQILSHETGIETKLKLFDLYKKKGGNSYIDLYIEQTVKAAKED